MLQIGVERMKGKGAKIEFVPQRKAIPTEKHSSGRAVCHYCGHCMQGCEVDSRGDHSASAKTAPLAKRKKVSCTAP